MSYTIQRQNGSLRPDGTPSYTYFSTYRTWSAVCTELERVNSLLWDGSNFRITDNRNLTELCIQGHAIEAGSPPVLPHLRQVQAAALPWVACK